MAQRRRTYKKKQSVKPPPPGNAIRLDSPASAGSSSRSTPHQASQPGENLRLKQPPPSQNAKTPSPESIRTVHSSQYSTPFTQRSANFSDQSAFGSETYASAGPPGHAFHFSPAQTPVPSRNTLPSPVEDYCCRPGGQENVAHSYSKAPPRGSICQPSAPASPVHQKNASQNVDSFSIPSLRPPNKKATRRGGPQKLGSSAPIPREPIPSLKSQLGGPNPPKAGINLPSKGNRHQPGRHEVSGNSTHPTGPAVKLGTDDTQECEVVEHPTTPSTPLNNGGFPAAYALASSATLSQLESTPSSTQVCLFSSPPSDGVSQDASSMSASWGDQSAPKPTACLLDDDAPTADEAHPQNTTRESPSEQKAHPISSDRTRRRSHISFEGSFDFDAQQRSGAGPGDGSAKKPRYSEALAAQPLKVLDSLPPGAMAFQTQGVIDERPKSASRGSEHCESQECAKLSPLRTGTLRTSRKGANPSVLQVHLSFFDPQMDGKLRLVEHFRALQQLGFSVCFSALGSVVIQCIVSLFLNRGVFLSPSDDHMKPTDQAEQADQTVCEYALVRPSTLWEMAVAQALGNASRGLASWVKLLMAYFIVLVLVWPRGFIVTKEELDGVFNGKLLFMACEKRKKDLT